MKKRREGSRTHRPSPALVIAIIALFLSLAGTSYAAVKLPAGSVGTKQLKNAAVTGAKIKNRAVTAAKISTVGLKVPSASRADSATSADVATTATTAATAGGVAAGAITDSSFSNTDAGAVAAAGGTITVSGTTPAFTRQFNRVGAAMTVTRMDTGFYEITVPGLVYSEVEDHITLVTLHYGGATTATISSIATHLVVATSNGSGVATEPTGFSFVVYK